MKKILYAEDEPAFNNLISNYLRKRGFDVTSALTVEEAKKWLAVEQFDLLLTDLQFEDNREGGFEIIRELIAKPFTENLPVVILSGSAREQKVREQVRNWDFVTLISKPLFPKELLSVVTRKVRKGKNFEE